jgi:hypothetical protein
VTFDTDERRAIGLFWPTKRGAQADNMADPIVPPPYNNPIPPVLQEQAKALARLMIWAEFPLGSEANGAARQLEHALLAFIHVNEYDELDDMPGDTLVTLEDVEASRADAQGFISEGQSPVHHPRELSGEDLAWLKQMRIAGRG